jgi:hypothetical protein
VNRKEIIEGAGDNNLSCGGNHYGAIRMVT